MTENSSLPITSINLKLPAHWHVPKELAISAQMASTCTVFWDPFLLQGIFVVTTERRWPCSPSALNDIHPQTVQCYAEMQHEYSQTLPQHPPLITPRIVELTVMGVKRGSLEKTPHQLYYYLIPGMLNVVCLQETWALLPDGWLNGPPSQHAASLPF